MDTVAIQAAFDAAIVDRHALHTANSPPPIVVQFIGPYAVQDELRIDPLEMPAIPAVVIEGVNPANDIPMLRFLRRSGAPTAEVLLLIRRVRSLTMRSVSFDGLGAVQDSLRVELSLDSDGGDHAIRLEECSWGNANASDLVISDASTSTPANGSLLTVIQRCIFTGVEKRFIRKFAPNTDVLHPLGTRHICLTFRGPFAGHVDVRGCLFVGYAWRAIRAEGGRVAVTGCRFEIVEEPGLGFLMATDVELTHGPILVERFASLTAISCVSGSPSFLRIASNARNSQNQPGGPQSFSAAPDVVLFCIKHQCVFTQLGNHNPPSVIWEEPNLASGEIPSAPDDSRLSLFGCSFGFGGSNIPVPSVDGPPPPPIPIPRVYLSARVGKVSNIGTFREVADMSDAYLTFGDEGTLRSRVWSLGTPTARMGPAPIAFRGFVDRPGGIGGWLLPFAWATWLWE